MVCTGSAVAACYQQGAKYANGEFIQVHPTAIPGADKLRLMSESARGEGAARYVGTGKNRWPFVHVDDLADLYLLALERAPAGSILLGVAGPSRAVSEVAAAASRGAGAGGRCRHARRRPEPVADGVLPGGGADEDHPPAPEEPQFAVEPGVNVGQVVLEGSCHHGIVLSGIEIPPPAQHLVL
jgi:hypothetical protein